MPELKDTVDGGETVGPDRSNTMRTSQVEQVHGYLESLTEVEFIDELQSALENAKRLTSKDWKIVVSADGVDIRSAEDSDDNAGGGKRIKIPKPKGFDR